MHTCTMCGLRKPELSSDPEFEFRSRRRHGEGSYIEGISDWCPQCEALRFFYKSNDSEDTGEYFMERPKQELANYMLEATTAGWQEDRSRPTRDSQELNSLRYWKAMDTLRQEARKVLREELLATVPSTLLRKNSVWDSISRSHSEDHKHRAHSSSGRRSRSVVNEVRIEEVQPQLRPGLQDVYRVEKRDQDVDESHVSVGPDTQAPIPKIQAFDLMSPWQDVVLRRTDEALAKHAKRKRKAGRGGVHGERVRAINLELEKKSGGIQRLTMEEVAHNMKKVEQEELNEHLFNKLQQKRDLVDEWETVRRRVQDECVRVKAELAALKQQCDGNHEDVSHGNMERQQGGAQLGEFVGIEPDVAKELNKDDVLKRRCIGDAIDSKLVQILDSMQESPESIDNMGAVLNTEFGKLLDTDLTKDTVSTESEMKEPKKQPSHHQQQHKPSVKTSAAAYALKPKRLLSNLHMLVSTVQRARFRGFPEDPQKTVRGNSADNLKPRDSPLAQFSTLPCTSRELVNLLAIKREVLQPSMARPLKVCRSPIFCPDADCQRMFFISDFNDHLTHEHPSLAMERISPCKAKTFFLDTRVILLNKAKCSMVYFVKDKFYDNNADKYPDLLPVLVMTARINAPHFFPLYPGPIPGMSSTKRSPDQEIYLIWLTSIRPDDVKIVGTISVWPTNRQPIVEYLTVQTSEVYNIRSGQRLKAIYNSNRSMALPGNVVSRMTDNGGHLLAVQVLIH